MEARLQEFFKNKHCLNHIKKRPNLVCLDYFCEHKGLICANCLTIQGKHKGHDSVELKDFLSQIEEKFSSAAELDRKFQEQCDGLLQKDIEQVRDFQARINKAVEAYVQQRTIQHNKKTQLLNTSNLIGRCKTADFESLEEFNEAIEVLSNKLKYKSDTTLPGIEADQISYSVEQQLQQICLDDFTNHIEVIQKYLNADILPYIESRVLGNIEKNHPRYFYQPLFMKEKSLSLNDLAKDLKDKESTYKGFYENQDLIYIGELEANIPHGKGLAFFRQSGKIYEGEYQQGKMHGKGRVLFQNGDSYTGDFRADKKQGRGIYVWKEKGNYFEGEFWNSKRHGQGLFISSDGSEYEGNFKDGLQSGMGILRKSNGEIEYSGQWSAGCFEGKGIQYLENGDKYNGEFQKDMFNGRGVYTKKDDGTEVHGIWKDNQLVVVNQTVEKVEQQQQQVQ